MSRIGKLPIKIVENVNLEMNGSRVTVSGPKGNLSLDLLTGITAQYDSENRLLIVERIDDQAKNKANQGLMRTLLANMVAGVSLGFSKKLELVGVGYRVNKSAEGLVLSIGLSHEVNFKIPSDLEANVDGNFITISGIDKQRVGQIAAEIRALKKPEPYKGKGIRYQDEYIIRKSGKSGKDK